MSDQQQDEVSPSRTMRKSVSFSRDVLVNLDMCCSMKQRQVMFLTSEDFDQFQEDVNVKAEWARSIGEKSLESTNKDDHVRGLEQFIDDDALMERKKLKFLGQLAVFMEQDRQFLEEGHFTPVDSDAMAERYGEITKHSKDLARKRAMFYQEMEIVNAASSSVSIESDSSIHMAGRSLEPRPRLTVGPSAA